MYPGTRVFLFCFGAQGSEKEGVGDNKKYRICEEICKKFLDFTRMCVIIIISIQSAARMMSVLLEYFAQGELPWRQTNSSARDADGE